MFEFPVLPTLEANQMVSDANERIQYCGSKRLCVFVAIHGIQHKAVYIWPTTFRNL